MGAVALRVLSAALAVVAAGAADAHALDDVVESARLAAGAGDASAAAPWWGPWSFEPWVVACLALSVAAYAFGLARLWRHAGRGRGVGEVRAAVFTAGWAVLALSLVSPLDAWGARLFWVHMVQHELMMVLAAPALVLGAPLAVWAWALPPRGRVGVGAVFRHRAWRAPWQFITSPLAAWTLHAAALWLWHLPACFDAALHHPALHVLQHLGFLFSALLFWWSVLGPRGRAAQGPALASLFTTMLHTGALGALLALSSAAWYADYAVSAPLWGWDALEDQQLGGLVMWAPAGLAYLAAALVVAARWMGMRPRALA